MSKLEELFSNIMEVEKNIEDLNVHLYDKDIEFDQESLRKAVIVMGAYQLKIKKPFTDLLYECGLDANNLIKKDEEDNHVSADEGIE
jgi:hypothetical protein